MSLQQFSIALMQKIIHSVNPYIIDDQDGGALLLIRAVLCREVYESDTVSLITPRLRHVLAHGEREATRVRVVPSPENKTTATTTHKLT